MLLGELGADIDEVIGPDLLVASCCLKVNL